MSVRMYMSGTSGVSVRMYMSGTSGVSVRMYMSGTSGVSVFETVSILEMLHMHTAVHGHTKV